MSFDYEKAQEDEIADLRAKLQDVGIRCDMAETEAQALRAKLAAAEAHNVTQSYDLDKAWEERDAALARVKELEDVPPLDCPTPDGCIRAQKAEAKLMTTETARQQLLQIAVNADLNNDDLRAKLAVAVTYAQDCEKRRDDADSKLAALKGTTEDEWMEIRNRLLEERDELRAQLAAEVKAGLGLSRKLAAAESFNAKRETVLVEQRDATLARVKELEAFHEGCKDRDIAMQYADRLQTRVAALEGALDKAQGMAETIGSGVYKTLEAHRQAARTLAAAVAHARQVLEKKQ